MKALVTAIINVVVSGYTEVLLKEFWDIKGYLCPSVFHLWLNYLLDKLDYEQKKSPINGTFQLLNDPVN